MWIGPNIEAEKVLTREYGLKNKKEIWKMNSQLKRYKDFAKKLIAVKTAQGEKEKKQMMEKLQRLGLINAGAKLDDVLSLDTKDIMERRLQSLVYRKGLARTMKQARQFIVHRQVMVGGRKITFPSYVVSQEEEAQLRFDPSSTLSKEDHPERISLSQGIQEEAEEIRKKPAKNKKDEEEPTENEKTN